MKKDPPSNPRSRSAGGYDFQMFTARLLPFGLFALDLQAIVEAGLAVQDHVFAPADALSKRRRDYPGVTRPYTWARWTTRPAEIA